MLSSYILLNHVLSQNHIKQAKNKISHVKLYRSLINIEYSGVKRGLEFRGNVNDGISSRSWSSSQMGKHANGWITNGHNKLARRATFLLDVHFVTWKCIGYLFMLMSSGRIFFGVVL